MKKDNVTMCDSDWRKLGALVDQFREQSEKMDFSLHCLIHRKEKVRHGIPVYVLREVLDTVEVITKIISKTLNYVKNSNRKTL